MAGYGFSEAHFDVYQDAIGHLMSIFECEGMHSAETIWILLGWMGVHCAMRYAVWPRYGAAGGAPCSLLVDAEPSTRCSKAVRRALHAEELLTCVGVLCWFSRYVVPVRFVGVRLTVKQQGLNAWLLRAKVCKGGHEGPAGHCMVQYIIS